jgi:uncharacterized zinc-type alcohol dehydrogenase-like protein
MAIRCYAARAAGSELTPFSYDPAALGPFDVEIAITHCGICHSDVHLIDNDWGISQYPLVPGHEIVGTVRAHGSEVKHLTTGQRVGVGWQRGSCLACEACLRGDERCCPQHEATCVAHHGGFAEEIRVDGRFAHPIPAGLSSDAAAPLLCAGITVYTPIKAAVRHTDQVGIIGVGGLGHLAIRFAAAIGCEVTAFSTTPSKEAAARQLGARHFVVTRDAQQMERAAESVDFLLSTVTAPLDWAAWLNVLRPKGTLWIVGASPGTLNIAPMALITGQKSVCGSAIGNRASIREMFDFAARHNIVAQTEVVPMSELNAAIARVRRNEARYRIVVAN